MGKPDRKRLFGRPGHRWKDKIKVNCKELGRRALTGLIDRLRIGTGHGLI